MSDEKLEDINKSVESVPPQSIVKPIEKPRSRIKLLIFGFVGIFLVILITSGGYYMGMKKSTGTSLTDQTNIAGTPTPNAAVVLEDEGIEIEKNTFSFTRIDGKIYLRYKNNIWKESKSFPSKVKDLKEKDYTWIGLINSPENVKYYTGYPLSISQFNDNKFIFVIADDEKVGTKLSIWRYDPNKEERVDKLAEFYNTEDNEPTVPFVREISDDGKYAIFDIKICTQCDSPGTGTSVMNLETKEYKYIGVTSYFKMGEDGSYEYKIYKATDCNLVEGPALCPPDLSVSMQTGRI